ncbi:hypothetical protein ACHRVK_14370 [Flavobacterium plurextorum]|uniref:hypothetical protein n=1 Tax=Flavobacterium plurextorum TaxID=1114867 RepID=UPI0037582A30
MISDNIKILIGKLKTKIEANQAIWSRTSRDTEFKLELQKGAITVDSWEDSTLGSVVDLAIFNENGDIVDSVAAQINEDPEDYKVLLEIYELAKKSYFKVDETLKTIFDELDSPKTVGKDNRLPF